MSLFGPPNVEKLKAKRDIQGLMKALNYQKDHRLRQNAAKALGQIEDARAVEPLIAALKDEVLDVTYTAEEALVKIGKPAVEPLIAALKALKVSEWMTYHYDCYSVSNALARIGQPAVEPLIAALKDSDRNVRQIAAITLGTIGDARAVGPLIAALMDSDWDVRRRAAAALVVGIGQPAVEPLIAALKDSDERWEVIGLLGEVGTPAVEPFIAALKDQNWIK